MGKIVNWRKLRPSANITRLMKTLSQKDPQKPFNVDAPARRFAGLANEQTAKHKDDQSPQAIMLDAMDLFLNEARRKGLTLSSLQLLVSLHCLRWRSARLNKLAHGMGITTAALTGVADKLDSLGLAEREDDPLDRRAILLKLTPEGINFASLIDKALVSGMAKAFFTDRPSSAEEMCELSC
jgi:DNA-binding MarR family transcriptional regulator